MGGGRGGRMGFVGPWSRGCLVVRSINISFGDDRWEGVYDGFSIEQTA